MGPLLMMLVLCDSKDFRHSSPGEAGKHSAHIQDYEREFFSLEECGVKKAEGDWCVVSVMSAV